MLLACRSSWRQLRIAFALFGIGFASGVKLLCVSSVSPLPCWYRRLIWGRLACWGQLCVTFALLVSAAHLASAFRGAGCQDWINDAWGIRVGHLACQRRPAVRFASENEGIGRRSWLVGEAVSSAGEEEGGECDSTFLFQHVSGVVPLVLGCLHAHDFDVSSSLVWCMLLWPAACAPHLPLIR